MYDDGQISDVDDFLREAVAQYHTENKGKDVIVVNAVLAAEIVVDGQHAVWSASTDMPVHNALGLSEYLRANIQMEMVNGMRRPPEFD